MLQNCTMQTYVTMQHFEEAIKKIKGQKDTRRGEKMTVPYYR